jgi:KTSC domain
MERAPVTSTNICSVGYDTDNQILEVEFNSGAVYQFTSVPLGEYEGLLNADSKGKYFNANIKNRYSYVRL